jgi:tetratricopeptide (TPR) repeat protein
MCVSPHSPEFDQAMQKLVDYGLAIARGETDPHAFLEYAEALWDVRDLQGTVAALDSAIAGSPRLPQNELARAYASRSIAYLQMGNLPAAEADATASVELVPRGHPFGMRGLIHFYQGNYTAALRDAQEAFRLDPGDWEVRAWRGTILLEVGNYAEALEDFDWVLGSGECVRYASELHLARARAQLALGNAEAAESDCNEAIDLDYHEQSHWPFIVKSRARQAQNAYLVRAQARLALGAIARALGDCCFAATIAPGDPAVYALRARVYHAVGNVQEAIKDTLRADHLRPASSEATADSARATAPAVAVAA